MRTYIVVSTRLCVSTGTRVYFVEATVASLFIMKYEYTCIQVHALIMYTYLCVYARMYMNMHMTRIGALAYAYGYGYAMLAWTQTRKCMCMHT